MSKQKLLQMVTPPGIAVYPKLNEPDTKFKAAGEYQTRLRLQLADAKVQSFVETIDEAYDAAIAQAKKDNPAKAKSMKSADKPYKVVCDEEGNETGEIEFNFKMAASGVSKKTQKPWTRRPSLFDAKGQPLPADTKVGGGSTIKVSFEIMPFYAPAVGAGLSLRLQAVQVLDLVEYGQRTASAYGFEEEDGYAAIVAEQDAGAAGAENTDEEF